MDAPSSRREDRGQRRENNLRQTEGRWDASPRNQVRMRIFKKKNSFFPPYPKYIGHALQNTVRHFGLDSHRRSRRRS